MTDPYKVLGVSPDISDEDLKSVYRDLARKYHPDNYANNPLADLAGEKMKEINEAYDQIQQMRKSRGSTGQSSHAGRQSRQSQFSDIRRLIESNRITEAEELLDGVPQTQRDAEWFFLKGNVYYSRAWLEEAMTHFSQANRMDPGNPEYQAAVNQMLWQRRTANPGGSYGGYRTTQVGGCSSCDVCTSLICADCCCECMGGDLISCC